MKRSVTCRGPAESTPVTVTSQSGTKVVSIEKMCFRFIPGAMRAKLAAIHAYIRQYGAADGLYLSNGDLLI